MIDELPTRGDFNAQKSESGPTPPLEYLSTLMDTSAAFDYIHTQLMT